MTGLRTGERFDVTDVELDEEYGVVLTPGKVLTYDGVGEYGKQWFITEEGDNLQMTNDQLETFLENDILVSKDR